MEVDVFWQLVSLVGGYPPTDEEAAFLSLEDALAELGIDEIRAFAYTLGMLLHELDRKELAEIATVDTGRPQAMDAFLYNRCAVIVAGRKAFEAVIADPKEYGQYTDSRASSCRRLLYVPEKAYDRVESGEWRLRDSGRT